MKLKRKNIFLILCIVATFIVSCFAFASCKDDKESQEETSLSIELSDETVNLLLGDTYQLDYTLFNNDIEAVFLPVNGKGNNMNFFDAKNFAKRIVAKYCVPLHIGTFDDLTAEDWQVENKRIPVLYKELVL